MRVGGKTHLRHDRKVHEGFELIRDRIVHPSLINQQWGIQLTSVVPRRCATRTLVSSSVSSQAGGEELSPIERGYRCSLQARTFSLWDRV